MTFKCTYSSLGFPTFWERRQTGAFMRGTEIIADRNLEPKKPSFLANNDDKEQGHAAFIVKVGDLILQTIQVKDNITWSLYSVMGITRIGPKSGIIQTQLVQTFTDPQEAAEDLKLPILEKFAMAGKEKLRIEQVMSVYCRA